MLGIVAMRCVVRAVLVLPLVVTLGFSGCKQGKGERCQVDSDCGSGLICYTGLSQSVPPEGECQPEGYTEQRDGATAEDAGQDATGDAGEDAAQQDGGPQDAALQDSATPNDAAMSDGPHGDTAQTDTLSQDDAT